MPPEFGLTLAALSCSLLYYLGNTEYTLKILTSIYSFFIFTLQYKKNVVCLYVLVFHVADKLVRMMTFWLGPVIFRVF